MSNLQTRWCGTCSKVTNWTRTGESEPWSCSDCGEHCGCLGCCEKRFAIRQRAVNYDPDDRIHPASGPLMASPVFGPKHKASERLRALAQAACGTGMPAISSPDMRISASWEQLELVATELEKMGL